MAIRVYLDDVLRERGMTAKELCGKVGITESPKCAYYPRRRGINFVIRDLDTCIEAALTGEVK